MWVSNTLISEMYVRRGNTARVSGGCRASLHLVDYMSSHTVEKLRHSKNSDSQFNE